MSAETMKIPEPIIEPATIMVASKRPRSRRNPEAGGVEDASLTGAVSKPARRLSSVGERGSVGPGDLGADGARRSGGVEGEVEGRALARQERLGAQVRIALRRHLSVVEHDLHPHPGLARLGVAPVLHAAADAQPAAGQRAVTV